MENHLFQDNTKMTLLLLASILATAQAISLGEQWETFKLEHGKSYTSFLEEMKRFANFEKNLKEIEEHNERFDRGEVSYTMGINKFTDMTQEEFEATSVFQPSMPENVEWFNDSTIVGDENINWVDKGYVTDVKQQGSCASCWAFSSAGALEGQVKKVTGNLESLSAQNLLDCAPSDGCSRGGNMDKAFTYVKQNGILKESEYPAYQPVQSKCRKSGGQKISSITHVPPMAEDQLLRALTDNGPISVAIDCKRIKQYRRGIVDSQSGCSTNVNHAVLLVGAGIAKGTKYWLVKNSWGTNWGERGYIRFQRGTNTCGIAKYCLYPTI